MAVNAFQTENQTAVRGGVSFYRRLALLYILNLTDWLCTEALLKSGYFVEANPLMKSVMGGFGSSVLVKCVVPLVLILLCAVLFKLAGAEENKIAKVMLLVGIVAYSLVNVWHIFNFVLLFSVI